MLNHVSDQDLAEDVPVTTKVFVTPPIVDETVTLSLSASCTIPLIVKSPASLNISRLPDVVIARVGE
ncbi:hypothetical protein D3C74_218280 [compost metagenome]